MLYLWHHYGISTIVNSPCLFTPCFQIRDTVHHVWWHSIVFLAHSLVVNLWDLRPSEPFIKAEAALRGRRLFGWSAQTAIWHCTIGRVACATRGGGMLQDPRFGYLVLCPFLWFIEVFLYLKRHSVIWKGSFRVVCCFFWAAKFASESVGNRFLNTQFSTRSSLSCNIINTSSFASHFMRYLNRSFACSTARLARHSRTSWRIWHPPRVRESEKLKRRPCATRTYTDKDLGELEWRIGWYHPPKRMV